MIDFEANCKAFMDRWNEGANHRFRSYDYCKKLFDRYYKQVLRGKPLSSRQEDYFALNLFCYLASWGMLRGSGWLLSRSYKFFCSLCNVLFEKKFARLLDMDPLMGEYNSEEIIVLYDALNNAIRNSLQKDEMGDENASRLMLCKIIMGTYGCVIAYDKYDCAGLTQLGIHTYDTNPLTLDLLEQTCAIIKNPQNNFRDLKKMVKKSYDVKYTSLKILDMILWVEGEKNK